MVSKCKNWLSRWIELKERLRAEAARSKHYAMLYQNALEDSLELSQRNGELRRRVQELEQPEKKSDALAQISSAPRASLRSLLAF